MANRDQVRASFGIFAQSWNAELPALRIAWIKKCTAMVVSMMVCSMCGHVVFPHMNPSQHHISLVHPVARHAPAAVANMHLRDHVHDTPTPRRPETRWYVCYDCKQNGQHSKYLVRHKPQEMQQLLATSPVEVQLLAFLQVSTVLEERLRGFAHGMVDVHTLIRHPLVSWNVHAEESTYEPSAAVVSLLSMHMRQNPLYARYRCLLELDDPSVGLPIVPCAYISHIVENAISRGPRVFSETNPLPFVLSTVVDVPVPMLMEGEHRDMSMPVKAGELSLRAGAVDTRTSMVMLPGDVSDMRDVELTIEYALFPFLFPHGTGGFDGHMTLGAYLRMRMLQAFSVFTLFKPYVLLMFQVRQAVLLRNSVKALVLSKSISDFKRRNPTASDADAMAHAVKWTVPPSLPGTPAYHRKQLQDLLCRVDAWGLPDFFLTLSADEVSECRFEEINELDEFLRRFGASLNWEDAPVECSRLFLTRYKAFMKEWIVGPSSAQILGRVTHYVTRIEVQHRGSLHVHILLWVDQADVARVADEIIAYVPAIYNADTKAFVPPNPSTHPMEHALFNIVTRKHMHKCTPWAGKANGCRDDKGRCKMLFPVAVSPTMGTTFDSHIMRYVYCRPRECDRNVIPYHPTVALVWNANTNIQRITGTAWSFYVLKYAMKSEPAGHMNLGPEVAAALHLQDVSSDQLRLISNMVMAKPISPSEATVMMLQQELVEVSRGDAVTYICSSLPASRAVALRASRPCTHPIDKYCKRPADLKDVTFMTYFAEYDIRAQAKGPGTHVGADMAGRQVYKLSTPQLVRFTDYDPSRNSEGFFFQLLLRHVPFETEATLVSPGNDAEQPYFYECIIRGLFTNTEELNVHLEAYAKLHLYDEKYRNSMYEELMATLQGFAAGPLAEAFDLDPSAFTGARVRGSVSHMAGIQSLSDFDTASLNAEQASIVERITAASHGIHVISGVPGSGKTFLIKCIARAFTRSDKVVRVSATTGAAAARLGSFATTTHSFFALPVRQGDYIPSIARTDARFDELVGADVFIIDEMSMLTAGNLDMVLYRLYSAVKYYHPEATMENFMEHKLLLLVGDHAQLPAVCKCHVDEGDMCHRCHLSNSAAWSLTCRHKLSKSVRQADDIPYGDFLNEIRVEQPTQARLDGMISDRHVSDAEAMELAENGMPILTSHREDAKCYNKRVLDGLFPYTQRQLDVATNAFGEVDLVDWLYDEDYITLPSVAVGARIMVLHNILQKTGLVNGALGTVTRLHERGGEVYRIDVALDSNAECAYAIYRSEYKRTYHDGRCFYKATFPLQLAYSYTIHKCQGATLAEGAVVRIRSSFAPGMAYVALSRVPSR